MELVSKKDALEDLATHYRAWRVALMHAMRSADPKTEDTDDRGWWRHEIKVFDRTVAALIEHKE